MLRSMRGSLAPDLEETLREPLALTCCLPAAEIPVFESVYDAEDAATGYLDERPQRVIVRPLVSGNRKPAPKVNRQVRAIQPRPAPRKRPEPRAAVPQKPKRKVLPRANTIPNHPQ